MGLRIISRALLVLILSSMVFVQPEQGIAMEINIPQGLVDTTKTKEMVDQALKQIGISPEQLVDSINYNPELISEVLAKVNEYTDKGELDQAITMLDKIDINKAIEVLENAVASAPGNIDLYNQLGTLYEKAGIEGPKVFVNGIRQKFDVEPYVENDRTLVQLRTLAESMDAHVDWDESTQTVTITKVDKTIELVIGSKLAKVNGETILMEVAPAILF